MPELPEVETVRRGIAPVMEGAQVVRAQMRRADLRFPFPENFTARLEGARIGPLGRRGKYLIAPLSSGESLIMHLGMSGRFSVMADGVAAGKTDQPGALYYSNAPNPAHDHVILTLYGPKGRHRLVYNDPRRFGFMDLATSATIENSKHFASMGPEPLSNAFSEAGFNASLRAKSAPIKGALLDQSIVAGLGNIYVCEALFRAGVSPRRKAASVAGLRGARLFQTIRDVLEEAIEAGGSSLRDFAGSDGALGYFQHRFSVYDRAGEPCVACGGEIKRLVQSGRSTFYCGKCQK